LLLNCYACLILVLLLFRIWGNNLTSIKRKIAAFWNQNKGLITVLLDIACNLGLSALSLNFRLICLNLTSTYQFVKVVYFNIKSRHRSLICLHHYSIFVSSLVPLSANVEYLLFSITAVTTWSDALNALRPDSCCFVRLIKNWLLQRAIIKIYLRCVLYLLRINTFSFCHRFQSIFFNIFSL